MNIIDKILLEWSYKCSDGIVDLDDYDKVMILREMLDEESNNSLDELFQSDMSQQASEAIQTIKDKYSFEDNNFQPISKNSFKVLLPNNYNKSRTELMKDLEEDPDFKFDQGSIGAGSSIGRLRYKNNVVIYIKFAKGQGNESAGKQNEVSFIDLINKHTTDGAITVILKSDSKEIQYNNIIECKDSSKADAQDYAKADAQLINNNGGIEANISLKKRNAVRWESSKRRLNDLFNNFIKKTKDNELNNVDLQPVPGSLNKFKLHNPETDKTLSKVVITNTPDEFNSGFVFGKDSPKTVVVKEDFERYNNYAFNEGILTINCYKIYTDIEDVMGTPDEPVLAFSNHIGQAYGIELRVFSKGLLYNDTTLKGNSTEINYNDIK